MAPIAGGATCSVGGCAACTFGCGIGTAVAGGATPFGSIASESTATASSSPSSSSCCATARDASASASIATIRTRRRRVIRRTVERLAADVKAPRDAGGPAVSAASTVT
jgi:hypothetical protein